MVTSAFRAAEAGVPIRLAPTTRAKRSAMRPITGTSSKERRRLLVLRSSKKYMTRIAGVSLHVPPPKRVIFGERPARGNLADVKASRRAGVRPSRAKDRIRAVGLAS